MKHNDITVIILLYHTPKKLIQNIKNYEDFKLIILDQSNDFDTKKYLLKRYKNIIHYELSDKNLGFSKAQNFLINKVKTKIFFYTTRHIYTKEKYFEIKKITSKNKNNLIVVPNINETYKILKNILR